MQSSLQQPQTVKQINVKAGGIQAAPMGAPMASHLTAQNQLWTLQPSRASKSELRDGPGSLNPKCQLTQRPLGRSSLSLNHC